MREREGGGGRRRDRDREKRHESSEHTTIQTTTTTTTRHYSPTPDRHRHHRFRSPSPSSPSPSPSHSPSPSRHRRRRRRSPSPDLRRTRLRVDDGERSRRHRQEAADVAAVSDFVDGIAREHQKKQKSGGDNGEEGDLILDADEADLMLKLGFPAGFESTKGKPVADANVSGVRAVTKRQPRQYMNRRGGFNRPLPVERNR